ncbi:MAG: H+/Na+-translocating ferredoxin:NAD+ oxidoreductase subunit [Betaproteobacteria bacterium]|jgi:electron transport complex protein RnfB|nr:H+/Na+-translocating ferredoxin:NAD+ oxidoreductase subunit [Betaproteobacteria bacterium]
MKRDAVALVDESRCIGCTRCIDACPVDAIVGAQGLMHSVVEPWCIGCALCLPPCPVDCIDMVGARGAWSEALKRAAGRRARRRQLRISQATISPVKNRAAVLAAALARKRR